ncbi:MAG: aminotransferase class I/II-fold pyridoxal phosphate-dependent enzyme [Bryobacteraceae bacterium]|nr:aminotransferase class I/II-fold pyridoxal phosphate-dependent enzyme [Bryobacteraceae bacterium]
MISRRAFAQAMGAMAGAGFWSERALAQRALVGGELGRDMVWLNANENPDGPCPKAIEAMREVLPYSWRYHYQEFGDFYAAVARSEGLDREQVLVGAGSSEILHAAIDVFTAPDRPLITMWPTFEAPDGITRALGRPVIRVPLTERYAADVQRMAAEAAQAGGGLIYLCNPNNPTGTVTPKSEVEWLVRNLPANTVVLVDEAYIHFGDSPDLASALTHVRQGRDVIVARTFSKIYGMAGLRVGFGCAKPEFIRRMEPFRDNVISIVSARGVLAALAEAATLIPERRARVARLRNELCAWLKQHGFGFIESQANFVMIDVGRDVREVLPAMYRRGVAPGRPFPPLDRMMRVSIGTAAEMQKFRQALLDVLRA